MGDGWGFVVDIFGLEGIPAGAQGYHPQGDVGDAYHPWNPNIEGLQRQEIARLIIFYNDSFGINAGDSVVGMRQKIRAWLASNEF
jgi:hypothetical protein